jgi:hypothetical protein
MFMKNLKSLRGVAVILAALAVCLAPALAAGPSVGELLVKIAEAKNLDAADAATARASLQKVGMKLPALDLDKPLTQGDVVDISNSAGLSLRTSTPNAPVDQDQLITLGNTIGMSLDHPGSGGGGDNETHSEPWDNGADPRTKGKGLKKGLYKSPSEPI